MPDAASLPSAGPPTSPAPLRWVLGALSLGGSFLLFWIQPLIGKRLLPLFGGGAAVWGACLLFFQSALCLGYAYAYGNERLPSARLRRNVHLGLLLGACIIGVFTAGNPWKPAQISTPALQISKYLALSIGLPFVALASTSPLVQAWHAELHPHRSPYRLYALSNAGALLALSGYLLLFDPLLTIRQQTWSWFVGFLVFAGLFGWLTVAMGRRRAQAVPNRPTSPSAGLAQGPPAWRSLLLWLGLPAFSSAMLLATTNHICQDLASSPLLWVVPLALFLLSFIMAFDHPRWYRRAPAGLFAVAAIYVAAGVDHPQAWATARWLNELRAWVFDAQLRSWRPEIPVPWRVVAHCVALLAVCFVCHGELYRARPQPRHLTGYYLAIALGGAIGSALVTFAAPLAFTTYLEWEICLVGGYLLAMVVAFGVVAVDRSCVHWGFSLGGAALAGGLIIFGFGLVEVARLLADAPPASQEILERSRNFYGALAVVERSGGDSASQDRALFHGQTVHGTQFLAPSQEDWPTTYYSETSGAGLALARQQEMQSLRVGAVGMGIGTLAAYAQSGQTVRFYEINPDVVRVAESYFTYLQRAGARGANVEVVLGDARRRLEEELRDGPQEFDALILDAFNGDSIPNHLLTKEAFELYLRHLTEEGTIATHVSNRSLDLAAVVRRIADELSLDTIYVESPAYHRRAAAQAKWVVMARDPRRLDSLRRFASPGDGDRETPLWTDDHNSVWPVFRWRKQ